jgi:hypothetical protein
MSDIPPLSKAVEAFTEHKLVKIRKFNGQLLKSGYITIMYGEVAFRMQPRLIHDESQFIRMDEIKDIVFDDQETDKH